MPEPASPPSLARLAVLAALLHLGFDTLFRLWDLTTPPHLLLLQPELVREDFRPVVELLRDFLGPTPISAVTSFVNGGISAIFAVALQGATRRRLPKVFGLLTLVWLVVGAVTFFMYLRGPGVGPVLVVTSLLAGLPRTAAVAFFLERALPHPDGP
jgi:hypothetical protein